LLLYAITDRSLMGVDPRVAIDRLLDRSPGPLWIQLREKDLPAGALYQLAQEVLRRLPQEVPLLINGRVDVARSLGCGVHLPSDGLPVAEVRRLLGPQANVGCSGHSPAECRRLAEAGADLVTLSPIFESPGKGPPLGLGALTETKAGGWPAGCRLVALGGMDTARTEAARLAGADGVAMIRGAWT
jgi:thiamine-phosphate diphosphorylase